MSGSCRKNPKVTESFLQSRLQAKGEGGVWLATAGFLVSGPLLWRSGYGSGNAVSVNVCQMNLILCPDKRARSQGAALTLRGPSPAWEEQSSAGGSLKARFPHPVQLSSLREPGARLNWPSAASGGLSGGPGPTDRDPGAGPLLFGLRDGDEGEVHRCLKAWATAPGWSWGGLWSPAGRLFRGFPAQPLAHSRVSWKTSRRKPESASYFALHLITTTPQPLAESFYR